MMLLLLWLWLIDVTWLPVTVTNIINNIDTQMRVNVQMEQQSWVRALENQKVDVLVLVSPQPASGLGRAWQAWAGSSLDIEG